MSGPGETQCPHSDLDISFKNQAFEESNLHYLEISAKCSICEKPIVFRGLPLGATPAHPTGSWGGEEARLPFLAEGEELTGKTYSIVGKQSA